MPVSIDEAQAIARLRQAMEFMREQAFQMGGNAIPPSEGKGGEP
jgi:uncharacterized protein YbjQ (UPF0145 family)